MTDHLDNNPSNDDNNQENEPQPEFITSFTGRTISFFGLVERIVKQFELEHGEAESKAMQEIKNDVERRQLVRDVAEYIFGVESTHLSPHEQARVIAMANAELFGYGPLDQFFQDETVTTVSLEGARKVGVRTGIATELKVLDPIFDDTPHMRRMIERILRDAGAELRDDIPIIETGLQVEGRRVSLSVAIPPFVPELAVDIRIHPQEPATLDEWVERGILNPKSRDLLVAIMQSEHGLIIVGDTESGKTTLTTMLLQTISGEGLVSVERASELGLPESAIQLATKWASGDTTGITFGEQIQAALAKDPKTLVIDEIRNDEPHAIAPLLTNKNAPRQIWSFRGASEAKRLASSLGMLARMSDSTQAEHMVYQLHKRLPFMVIIKRRHEKLHVREIAEWQFPADADQQEDFVYGDFVSLMRVEWDDCEPTGKHPQNKLDLPDDFWEK